MSETDFCYWCGYSNRNRRGHCNVCYPPAGPLFTRQENFLAHVLFVRNPSPTEELNHIREGIEPHDIRKDRRVLVCRDTDSSGGSGSILSVPISQPTNTNLCDNNVSTNVGTVPNINVRIDLQKLKARLRK
jgi:hypothetical protein